MHFWPRPTVVRLGPVTSTSDAAVSAADGKPLPNHFPSRYYSSGLSQLEQPPPSLRKVIGRALEPSADGRGAYGCDPTHQAAGLSIETSVIAGQSGPLAASVKRQAARVEPGVAPATPPVSTAWRSRVGHG